VPWVQRELRRLAGHFLRKEQAGATLQATDPVQEVYLKLIDVRSLTGGIGRISLRYRRP